MKLFYFGPASGLAVAGLAVQQSGVTLSAELLISLIVNVAIVALAFGGVKSDLRNLRKDIDKAVQDFDKGDSRVATDLRTLYDIRLSALEVRLSKTEDRIDKTSSRVHRMANDLLAAHLMKEFPDDERHT